jgi:hypothetical protein
VVLAALSILLLWAAPAGAQLDQLLKKFPQIPGTQGIPGTGSIGDVRIGEALKEALQVGTANAVSLTGRTDGYFKNQAIKILMPEQLRTFERGLRAVGYGPQVDELVLGMNRAAERAAPQAKQIFWDAIGAMTIDDARGILNGGDTAATEYFKRTTSDPLTTAFRPVVEKAMGEVGVTRQYTELFRRAPSIWTGTSSARPSTVSSTWSPRKRRTSAPTPPPASPTSSAKFSVGSPRTSPIGAGGDRGAVGGLGEVGSGGEEPHLLRGR